MANSHNYRYRETNPFMHSVASATVIEIGDLVFRDTTAKPFSSVTWNTNIATTQEAAHDAFLGVALSASPDGKTDDIRIASTGVFEFDCASADFAVGDLVGPAKQSGNAIEKQKVVAVAGANLAIGRVAEAGTSLTKVKVAIESTIANGGPQTMM